MQLTSFWQQSCARHASYRMLDWVLRGCGQVMFQNNPLSGLLFFVAIFLACAQTQHLPVAWGCLLGTVVATAAAAALLRDRYGLAQGWYGYNGCLIGAALATFLDPTPLLWGVIAVSSVLSVGLTAATARALEGRQLPALTAPFVLVSWMVLLASHAFAALIPDVLPAPMLPQWPAALSSPGAVHLSSLLTGVSQVFLLDSPLAGVVILLGLACNDWRAVLAALLGSALAMLLAWLLAADTETVNEGLDAFSAVLTALALGWAFPLPGWRGVVWCLAGIAGAVLLQGALNTLLMPLGMPSFTMPFVLVTWSYLLAKPLTLNPSATESFPSQTELALSKGEGHD